MRAIRDLMRQRHPECTWAVEYRTQPGEDALLSPTQGAESVTISVHQAVEHPWEPFFRDAEAIFLAHDGRPHWGKLHWLDADAVAARYPALPAFETLRRQADPAGVFLNDHLRGMGFGTPRP
jgi:FAD/FMN-containing dehydrogenase